MRRAAAALLALLLVPPLARAEGDLAVAVVPYEETDPTLPPLAVRAVAVRVTAEGPFDPVALLSGPGVVEGKEGIVRLPVPPGEGRILLAASGAGYAPGVAFVPAEGPPRVVLRPAAAARVRVLAGEAGPPVAGATLRLTMATGYEREGDARVLRTATTGEDGRAAIPDLDAGPFFDLEARAKGFARGRETFVLAGGVEVTVPLVRTGRISGRVLRVPGGSGVNGAGVRAGEVTAETAKDGTYVLEDVPPGLVELEATAQEHLALDRPSILVEAGKTAAAPDVRLGALGSVRVLVQDPKGAPVEGVAIRLLPAEGSPRPAGPPPAAKTGKDGALRLSPVAPGAGHRLLLEPPAPFAPAVTPAFAALPGEAVDLGALRLDAGGILRGSVLGPDGQPVPGATVTLFDGEEDPLRVAADPAAGGPLRREEPAKEDGTFALARVPTGSRSLLARAPGRRPASGTRLAVLAGMERKDLLLVLAPGAAASGRLLDAEGGPIPDALLVALAPPLDAEAGRCRTGRDGTFLLEGLPAGALRVRALLPGEAFPDPLRPLFDVLAPSERNELRVPPSRAVEGMVVDPAGRSARSVVIVGRLVAGPVTGPLLETVKEVERVPTAEDGTFATRPLPEGRYRFRAETPDGRLAAADAEVGEESAPRLRLVLSSGSTVRGRVLAGPGNASLKSVAVRLLLGGRSEAAVPPATIDEGGIFAVHGVPPGEHDLVVSLPGLAPVSLRHLLVPPEGGVVDVGDVFLGQGTGMRLRVYGETRAPLPGVVVAVIDEAGLRREETTNQAGLALFSGLAEGAQLLELKLPGGLLLRRPIDVPSAGEFEEVVDLGLDTPGQVALRRSGAPVPGAAVRILDAVRGAGAYAGSVEVLADDRGIARIPALPQGPMLVEVTPPGEPPIRLSVRCEGKLLEIELPADGIDGTVESADTSKPVPNATVRAYAARAERGEVAEVLRLRGVSTTADNSGRFRFPSLPPGGWILEVSARGFGTARAGPVRVLAGGGATTTSVQMPRAGRVRGAVRDTAGRPVPGALLEATDPATGTLLPGGRAAADAAGQFDLTGLSPGSFVLTARAGGVGASPPETLSLAPGETREFDLWLVPGGTLEILVVGPGGAPVADAAVEVRDFFGTPVPLPEETGGVATPLRGEGRTRADGVFRVPGLRAGIYIVRAWKDGIVGESRARVDARNGARTVVALLPAR